MNRDDFLRWPGGWAAWLGFTLAVAAFLAGCAKPAVGNSALGETMGRQTAALLGGKGNVVLLISETGTDRSAGLAETMAAFRKGLGQSVQVSAVENLGVRPMPGMPLLTPQKFSEVLQKYATADALVSWVMRIPPSTRQILLMSKVPSM